MADLQKFLDQAGVTTLWARIKSEIINNVASNEDLTNLKQTVQQHQTVLDSLDETILDGIITWVADADDKYDTLKEISDWIKNDHTGAAQMAEDIEKLKELLGATQHKDDGDPTTGDNQHDGVYDLTDVPSIQQQIQDALKSEDGQSIVEHVKELIEKYEQLQAEVDQIGPLSTDEIDEAIRAAAKLNLYVHVPSPTFKPLGEVTVADMISDDTYVGTDGKVHGTVYHLDNYKEFNQNNPAEQTGNFFPFRLNVVNASTMTFKKNDQPNKTDIPFDKDIVFKVTSGDKWAVYVDQNETPEVTLDFSTATLSEEVRNPGAVNIIMMGQQEQTPMYGNKQISELMGEDVTVTWDGTKGTVTGTIHNLQDPWNDLPGEGEKTGHFFAFKVNEKYRNQPFTYKRNGEQKGHAPSAGDDEMFWVLRLDGHQNETYTFESNNKVIAEFDFSGVTLE